MRKHLVSAVILIVGLAAAPAYAQLERMGPISTANGYPTWFQDKTGLALEFCSPLSQAELDAGWCLILPGAGGAPQFPEVFPDPASFFDEHFYWAAGAAAPNVDPNSPMIAKLTLALEAAFTTGVVSAGNQMTFGRLRIVITRLPAAGTYTVETPYGTYTFANQIAGDRIFFTDDIGVACPGTFTCTLATQVAPFLLPSITPGGPELPPVSGPTGRKYIADPAYLGPATGSPVINSATGTPQNWFNIYLDGVLIAGTQDFSLMGRVFEGSVPGKVTVDRASLTMTGAQQLDVFSTAIPTMQTRLPGAGAPVVVTPVLGFYDADCGIAADGSLIAPAGAAKTQMFGLAEKYWGQKPGSFAQVGVCVVDESARTITGAIVPTFTGRKVTDDITIASATWNPASGALAVSASSSCSVGLRLVGYGDLVGSSISANTTVPPAEVNVVSLLGGSATLPVKVGAFTGGGPGGGPIAVNDAATLLEDTSVNIDVLANDTNAAGATINLGVPRLGSASLLGGLVHYVPNPNANGADSIAYSITVGGVTSPLAFVAINITPVNDAPTAVNNSFSAVNGVPIALNVLANDTDPDGAADLANVQIVTPPAGATAVVGAGGVVTFTGASGTYTFSYRAVDQAGVVSGNVATVTVVVANAETIAFVRSDFIGNKLRWRIDGTDTLHAGQTITVSFNNGTRANGTSLIGTVIGTASVDPTGAWTIDLIVASNDIRNVSNAALYGTRPNQVKATSSASAAAQTNPIALK